MGAVLKRAAPICMLKSTLSLARPPRLRSYSRQTKAGEEICLTVRTYPCISTRRTFESTFQGKVRLTMTPIKLTI
jgi:hypothetical protein